MTDHDDLPTEELPDVQMGDAEIVACVAGAGLVRALKKSGALRDSMA